MSGTYLLKISVNKLKNFNVWWSVKLRVLNDLIFLVGWELAAIKKNTIKAINFSLLPQ